MQRDVIWIVLFQKCKFSKFLQSRNKLLFYCKTSCFLTLDGISKKKHDSFITYSLLQYAIIFATEQVGWGYKTGKF